MGTPTTSVIFGVTSHLRDLDSSAAHGLASAYVMGEERTDQEK